jgi:ATP-binding cassette, subfamily B, bacterial HlyB/CyaB
MSAQAARVPPESDVVTEEPSAGLTDLGLICLLLVARFYDLPADGAQLQHLYAQSGQPLSEADLLRAATHIGLHAGVAQATWDQLIGLPVPAMARLVDGQYLVVAKIHEEQVLVQHADETRPLVLSRHRFEMIWTGELLLFAKQVGVRLQDLPFDGTWFIPAIVKYRKLFGQVVIASCFLQLFALLTPLCTQVVIDKVLAHKGIATLHVLAGGIVALALFEAILGGLRTSLAAHTTTCAAVTLGARLFRHILALPLSYFESRPVGETVARVREWEQIRRFLAGQSITVAVDVACIAVFLVVMWFSSATLTLIVMASLPIYGLLALAITPAIRSRLHEQGDRGAESHALMVEAVSGVHTVKAMAIEPSLCRKWDEQLAGYVRAGFRATSLLTMAGHAAACVQQITTVAVLWVGAYRVLAGELTIGQLIAFTMWSALVTGPLLRVVTLWQEFQQVGVSVRRLGDVLNAQPEPSYHPDRTTLPCVNGQVCVEDLVFRYRPDGPAVLKKLSFTAEPGRIIGFVGRSGSGKSTIATLMQRLYVPEQGRILIDGVDVTQVDPAWLRRQVGVVRQEHVLFNASVRENIALIDPGMAMEQVIEAATLAGAHEFIMELADGYDTVIGEQGRTLSSGQRQLIAIARALAANPRILIFDEAISALDEESDAAIQQNMARISHGRTVFLMAHRLSAVRQAHRIYVIERGEIVEQGTYGDLLRTGKCDAKWHAHQAA